MSERDSQRRRARPAFEPLETRDLPSVAALLAAGYRYIEAPSPRLQAATPTMGAPTPHELARRTFFAAFRGVYYVGPPRLTDQSAQFYLRGGGTSNAFLHGDLQLAFYPPAASGGETTGVAALTAKSVSNTGDQLGLDLNGVVPPPRPGLPFVLNWTVNGTSGGSFAGATGSGTVEIRLRPGARLRFESSGAGVADVIFRGSVVTSGVNDITRV